MSNAKERDSGISVNFVIRNGVKQGYPFWESLKSCLSFADEVVISEGCSLDGTAEVIRKFVEMYGDQTKFRLYRDDWSKHASPCGEIISIISDKNMRRCEREWVYYLQADEILHPNQAGFIRNIASNHSDEFNSVSFRFTHFINSWIPLPKGHAYDEAIRMTKNDPGIKFLGDAWNFCGDIKPICPAGLSPEPIYHLGWVFPKNCDNKSVEHGEIYKKMGNYQKSAAAARERMEKGEYTALPVPDNYDNYPECIPRMFGLVEYELPPEAAI